MDPFSDVPVTLGVGVAVGVGTIRTEETLVKALTVGVVVMEQLPRISLEIFPAVRTGLTKLLFLLDALALTATVFTLDKYGSLPDTLMLLV